MSRTLTTLGLALSGLLGTASAGLAQPVVPVDNCPNDPNPSQVDSAGDGSGDPCDLCAGDDAGGDADVDGLCVGSPYECDDMDPTNACAVVFDDGFESGDTSAWSATVNRDCLDPRAANCGGSRVQFGSRDCAPESPSNGHH